eukprot:GHRQ01028927.1.p2 GENE.GHRQ01028927.1~~GHRQ01028927.1.p2  ORF type:complete len:111 (-),score=18.19 GHRQ01028927.1:28-360(-)
MQCLARKGTARPLCRGGNGQRVALLRPVRAVVQRHGAAEEAALEQESPFLDPMIRSFLLGISAGAACEAAHVGLEAMSLAGQGSAGWLQAVQQNLGQYTPMFVWDHVAAV